MNLFSLSSQQLESDNFVRFSYIHLHLSYLEIDAPLILWKQGLEQSTSLQLLWGSIFDDCAQYHLINCINSLQWFPVSCRLCVCCQPLQRCFPQAAYSGAVSRHMLPKTCSINAIFETARLLDSSAWSFTLLFCIKYELLEDKQSIRCYHQHSFFFFSPEKVRKGDWGSRYEQKLKSRKSEIKNFY